MKNSRRLALAALTAAGLLWGTTVPLSKVALTWLPPAWLTVTRFAAAALIMLLACARTPASRARLRAALTPGVIASGAIGYGGSVLLQNAGITRTSVSSAALLIGATPVLVALIAAGWYRAVARPVAWLGFAVSLAGVGLVAGGGGGGASLAGDGLVLASLLLSAGATVALGRLVGGRDPAAVTAVQFLAAALAVLPTALVTEPVAAIPAAPAGAVLAAVALAIGGTVAPFTLFAYGQARIPAEVAGAFLNIEPLVGAVAGVVVFGNPAGLQQLLGGAAILAGIGFSSLPLLTAARAEAGPAEVELAETELGEAELAETELAETELAEAELGEAELAEAELAGAGLAAAAPAGAERGEPELMAAGPAAAASAAGLLVAVPVTAGPAPGSGQLPAPIEPAPRWGGPPNPAAGLAGQAGGHGRRAGRVACQHEAHAQAAQRQAAIRCHVGPYQRLDAARPRCPLEGRLLVVSSWPSAGLGARHGRPAPGRPAAGGPAARGLAGSAAADVGHLGRGDGEELDVGV